MGTTQAKEAPQPPAEPSEVDDFGIKIKKEPTSSAMTASIGMDFSSIKRAFVCDGPFYCDDEEPTPNAPAAPLSEATPDYPPKPPARKTATGVEEIQKSLREALKFQQGQTVERIEAQNCANSAGREIWVMRQKGGGEFQVETQARKEVSEIKSDSVHKVWSNRESNPGEFRAETEARREAQNVQAGQKRQSWIQNNLPKPYEAESTSYRNEAQGVATASNESRRVWSERERAPTEFSAETAARQEAASMPVDGASMASWKERDQNPEHLKPYQRHESAALKEAQSLQGTKIAAKTQQVWVSREIAPKEFKIDQSAAHRVEAQGVQAQLDETKQVWVSREIEAQKTKDPVRIDTHDRKDLQSIENLKTQKKKKEIWIARELQPGWENEEIPDTVLSSRAEIAGLRGGHEMKREIWMAREATPGLDDKPVPDSVLTAEAQRLSANANMADTKNYFLAKEKKNKHIPATGVGM